MLAPSRPKGGAEEKLPHSASREFISAVCRLLPRPRAHPDCCAGREEHAGGVAPACGELHADFAVRTNIHQRALPWDDRVRCHELSAVATGEYRCANQPDHGRGPVSGHARISHTTRRGRTVLAVAHRLVRTRARFMAGRMVAGNQGRVACP